MPKTLSVYRSIGYRSNEITALVPAVMIAGISVEWHGLVQAQIMAMMAGGGITYCLARKWCC
jgi:hypothetical protein